MENDMVVCGECVHHAGVDNFFNSHDFDCPNDITKNILSWLRNYYIFDQHDFVKNFGCRFGERRGDD